MWSGPNMRYNTVILFEGLGKKLTVNLRMAGLLVLVCNTRLLHHEVLSSGPRLGVFPSNAPIQLR